MGKRYLFCTFKRRTSLLAGRQCGGIRGGGTAGAAPLTRQPAADNDATPSTMAPWEMRGGGKWQEWTDRAGSAATTMPPHQEVACAGGGGGRFKNSKETPVHYSCRRMQIHAWQTR